jgi:hypothetical protein
MGRMSDLSDPADTKVGEDGIPKFLAKYDDQEKVRSCEIRSDELRSLHDFRHLWRAKITIRVCLTINVAVLEHLR